MGEKLDKAIDWIRLNAGKCAANTELQDAKAAVELAKERLRYASNAGEFLKLDSRILGKMAKIQEKLNKLSEALGLIEHICKDVDAIFKIHNAVRTLSDPNIIDQNPEKAARAFGQIFVGFGILCHHSPSPLKEWGSFFSEMGDFFENVRYGLDPILRKPSRRLNDEATQGGRSPLW